MRLNTESNYREVQAREMGFERRSLSRLHLSRIYQGFSATSSSWRGGRSVFYITSNTLYFHIDLSRTRGEKELGLLWKVYLDFHLILCFWWMIRVSFTFLLLCFVSELAIDVGLMCRRRINWGIVLVTLSCEQYLLPEMDL